MTTILKISSLSLHFIPLLGLDDSNIQQSDLGIPAKADI